MIEWEKDTRAFSDDPNAFVGLVILPTVFVDCGISKQIEREMLTTFAHDIRPMERETSSDRSADTTKASNDRGRAGPSSVSP